MAYRFYLDGVALPVAPSKLSTKIKNKNKTLQLLNDEEVNILKNAGLTEIKFKAELPYVMYPFAYYPQGFFKPAQYFLDKLEKLKTGKKPFQFLVSRVLPSGKGLFDTDIRVSLESYDIDEDARDGQSLTVSITLKQYVDYSTKVMEIKQGAKATKQAKQRPQDNAPAGKTYTVAKGDSLWAIAKKQLGNGARYKEIYNLNKDKIKNPNLIYAGQVLTLPR